MRLHPKRMRRVLWLAFAALLAGTGLYASSGAGPQPAAEISGATLDASLALEPWAPAASVFKLVTASALVAGGTDGDTNVCFHGGIRSVTESNLRDDKRDNVCHTLTFGVAHSNNALVGKLAYQKL